MKSSPEGEIATDMSDFRKVGEIWVAYKGVIRKGGEEAGAFEIKQFDINPPVDDTTFKKPGA